MIDFLGYSCYYIDNTFLEKRGATTLYCSYSRLRRPDMDLGDICFVLEVSQGEIADALGVSKTLVRAYINDDAKNKSTLNTIYRYLNSREFYNGYRFMPSQDFSKMLDTEIISVLKSKVKESDYAKASGISGKKLSQIKNGWRLSGSAVKVDIFEQYNMLMAAYELCADENGYVAEEFLALRQELKQRLALYYPKEIKTGFSQIIDDVLNARRMSDEDIINTMYPPHLRERFMKYYQAGSGPDEGGKTVFLASIKKVFGRLGDDLDKLRCDDEFIMDLDIRCGIVEGLRDLFDSGLNSLSFKDKVMPYSLYRASIALLNPIDVLMEGDILENDSLDFLYRYPAVLRNVILDYSFAFVEEENSAAFCNYLLKNYDESSGKYILEEYIEGESFAGSYLIQGSGENSDKLFSVIPREYSAWYKLGIENSFRSLSDRDRAAVCKELSKQLGEYADRSLGELSFMPDFNEDGKLMQNSENTRRSEELSDISQLMFITDRVGPLRGLSYADREKNSRSSDRSSLKNREYILSFLQNYDDMYCEHLEEIIDKKLDFDALDWFFWGLMSQAVYAGLSLEEMIGYINSLAAPRSSRKKKSKGEDCN